MGSKAIRLLKALRYETLKRLPYVVALLFILGIGAAWQSYRKTSEGVQIARDNTGKIQQLGLDNKKLLEQNNALQTQNLQLARENAKHIDCVAALFAQWTRTGQPIQGLELKTCIILTLKEDTSAKQPARGEASPQKQSPNSSSSSSPKSAPKKDNGQTNNVQPKTLDCEVDILIIHLGCP